MDKGTFIKLTYTGKLSDGTVFDTTDPEAAKEVGITREVKPVVICLGEGHLLPGLDEGLVGKDLGKHTVAVPAEKAFGKKSTKNMELVPKNQLQKQGITPRPGMELEIDGKYGIVKNISGGRVIVDFNHPLASQDVTYDVNLMEEVKGLKEQVEALLDIPRIPYDEVVVSGENVTIKVPQIYPQPIMDAVQEKITTLTAAKAVSFEQGQKTKKDENQA